MIAPQPRLIFWCAGAGVPLALLWAAEPGFGGVIMVIAAAALLVAAVDALFGRMRLTGLNAGLPPMTRLSKRHEAELELWLEQPEVTGRARRPIRVGIPFPDSIDTSHAEQSVMLPEDGSRGAIACPCVATKRGDFRIERVYVETPSPMGLWALRKSIETPCTLRVYPDLMAEQRRLAAMFLNRGVFGLHAQRQVGKGREFEKLREYVPGDSYDDISWKATARRGRPITQVYQIERTQEVYVVLDMSRLSGRLVDDGNGGMTTQLERFVTAGLVLGLAAEKQGDLFGVAAFDEHMRTFVRARNGKAHYGACRDALFGLQPAPVNPDFGDAFSFLRLRLRRRALLIFLTNLDDPVLAGQFLEQLKVLSSNHLVLVNMLAQPEVEPLFTDASVRNAQEVYERLAGHMQWRALRDLERTLGHRGVAMRTLRNERLCPELVTQYVNVKRRQLL